MSAFKTYQRPAKNWDANSVGLLSNTSYSIPFSIIGSESDLQQTLGIKVLIWARNTAFNENCFKSNT